MCFPFIQHPIQDFFRTRLIHFIDRKEVIDIPNKILFAVFSAVPRNEKQAQNCRNPDCLTQNAIIRAVIGYRDQHILALALKKLVQLGYLERKQGPRRAFYYYSTETGRRWEEEYLKKKWAQRDLARHYRLRRQARKRRRLLASAPSDDRQAYLYCHNLGVRWVEQGFWEDGEYALQQALKQNPEGEYTWLNLGLVQFCQERERGAEISFKTALEYNPRNEFAHYGLLRLLDRQERWVDAESSAQALIELKPRKAEYCFRYSRLLYFQNRIEEAASFLQKARFLRDYYNSKLSLIEPWVAQAQILEKGGKNKQAEEIFNLLLKCFETVGVVWGHYGSFLYDQGRIKDAEEAYVKAVGYEQRLIDIWWYLGTIWEDQGFNGFAEHAYRQSEPYPRCIDAPQLIRLSQETGEARLPYQFGIPYDVFGRDYHF